MVTRAVRLIETCSSKQAAEAAMLAHAAELRERGDTARFGVFVKRIPAAFCWGVYLMDRQYAPSRTAARNPTRKEASR